MTACRPSSMRKSPPDGLCGGLWPRSPTLAAFAAVGTLRRGHRLPSLSRGVIGQTARPGSSHSLQPPAGSYLEALLFRVSRFDLVTFSSVPIVICVVTLIACALPAWRASRVDPLIALRD